MRPSSTAVARRGSVLGEGERGSSSVEAILVLPVLIGIFFVIIHAAVWMQAGNVAQSTASSAYNTARLYDATAADGQAAGYSTADQAGAVLGNPEITVVRTATTVTVTVTGDAPTLVPGFTTRVERTVSGPLERWIDQ